MSQYGGSRNFVRGRGSREERPRQSTAVYVARQDCGKIIGRGGSKIRELQDSTQARIKVSRDDEQDGTRKVEISGSQQAVEEARRRIEDLVGLGGGRNSAYGGDDDSWDQRNPRNHCDRRERGGGSSDQWSAEYRNDRYEDSADGWDNTSPPSLHGTQDDWNDSWEQAGTKKHYDTDRNQRNGGSSWGQQRGGFRSGGSGSRSDYGAKEVIYVSSSDVGRIIGKGGSKIREIEEESGGTVKVSRDQERDGTKRVEISGSEAAVEDAKRIIDDLIGNGGSRNDGYDSSDDVWAHTSANKRNFKKERSYGDSVKKADNHGDEEDSGPKQVIYVNADDVGRIIGRGGSKIKEIEEESDCSVKVSNHETQDGEIAITLRGFKESMAKAKRLISKTGVRYTEEESDELKPDDPGYIDLETIDWGAVKRNYEEYQRQKFAALMPIVKEFYEEEDHVKNMHPADVKQFRLTNNNIMVQNPDCPDMHIPNPVPGFKECFRNYPDIMKQIEKQGFTRPSPIQTQAWPILLSGLDLIGIAQTGTGKTLAFLLPALIHIDRQPLPRSERKGPSMLVLCPTRELALQIEEEVEKFNYKGIRSICVYGGGSRREQVLAVKKGVEIVVATPGRLNDLVNSEIIDLTYVTYLVLDEADRMLDMGFEPDIRKSLLDIRPDRQTVMTSATWPPDVQSLAKKYMCNPMHVQVGTMDLAAVHSVRQEVVFMEDHEKKENLFYFLENMQPNDKVIVFAGKKAMVDDLSSDLTLKEIDCQSIHGDREQCDRIQALEDFKTGEVRILVATDVASRGLDVKDITHVLNFDFPRNIEEYVHRIGRTGRAGRTGESITFMTRSDWSSAQKLVDIMAEANQEIPQELLDMADRYKARKERDGGHRGGRGGRGRGGRRFGGGGMDNFCF